MIIIKNKKKTIINKIMKRKIKNMIKNMIKKKIQKMQKIQKYIIVIIRMSIIIFNNFNNIIYY